MPEAIWTIVGSTGATACLAELIEERKRLGPVALAESMDEVPTGTGYILQVGGSAPDDVFIRLATLVSPYQRRVPIGWLPDDGKDGLLTYAAAAAQVIRRQARGLKSGPVVLLGQWQERTLKLVDTVEELITLSRFRWTAERLVRRDLLRALRCGPGVAIYFGHAVSRGWIGYGGISAETLIATRQEPLGAVLSIACETAHRTQGCWSFCEELVLGGFCAAALGASSRSLHEHNCILARGLCSALGRAQNLGDALAISEVSQEFLSNYRIIGDPAAPLLGATHAESAAKQVYAPAPDDFLQIPEPIGIADL
jgi:hypothetical protein